MMKTKLKKGDVVQIGPEAPNASIRGCLVTVLKNENELDAVIEGYITVPGHRDSLRVLVTVASYEHFEYVGKAQYVSDMEWSKH